MSIYFKQDRFKKSTEEDPYLLLIFSLAITRLFNHMIKPIEYKDFKKTVFKTTWATCFGSS